VTESLAQATVPTAYGQWSIDNELGLTTGSEINGKGVGYDLIYAFGLLPEAGLLPIELDGSASGVPLVTLLLQNTGLNLGLDVEFSSSLNPDDWESLGSAFLQGRRAFFGSLQKID
jgi:hypothetical protein